ALTALFLPTFAGAQNTICLNERCYSCTGTLSCSNNRCTCNGVPIEGTPSTGCGGLATATHPNGGGRVSAGSTVAASVYVSANSIVCGEAVISGNARLVNGSAVTGGGNVSGNSLLDASNLNGSPTVVDSSLTRSTLNGDT